MDEIIESLNNIEMLLKVRTDLVQQIGDCPNLEIKVFGEPIFWKTIKQKNGWECQQNIIFGNARVVSPDNIRKAQGSLTAMKEKMDRLVSKSFLKPGDVIGVSRKGLYEHYAIYIGNDRVIHYCGEGNDFGGRVSVHEAPLCEFIKDSRDYFVVWFDEGRPIKLQCRTAFIFNSTADLYNSKYNESKKKTYSAEETIKRAKSRIGEEQYNLVSNNCEHFAMWCKTGVSESSQVNQIVRFAFASGVTGCGLEQVDRKLLAI